MSYYFLYRQKKIPGYTAYGFLFVITLGLALTMNMFKVQTTTRASKGTIVQELKASNITATSATISFVTKEPIKAYINLQSVGSVEPRIGFDAEDSKKLEDRKIHYITFNNLASDTTYSYKILIGDKGAFSNNSYSFRTLSSHIQGINSSTQPFFGKVTTKRLLPAKRTLIYLSFPQVNKNLWFSALSKDTGEWIVTIPLVYSQKFTVKTLVGADEIVAYFIGSDQITTGVKARLDQMSPLKTIVLGQSYDLVNDFSTPDRVVSDQVLGVMDPKTVLQIISPLTGAILATQYPVIKGVARPASLLNIQLEPKGTRAVVQTNTRGEWNYTVLKGLLPGAYVFSAEQGLEKKKLSFVIGKSGESVLGEATPSGKLEPTLTPLLLLTQIPPIGSVNTNPTSTIVPTVVPTRPIPTVTTKGIPTAGANTNLIIGIASGISLLGLIFVLY